MSSDSIADQETQDRIKIICLRGDEILKSLSRLDEVEYARCVDEYCDLWEEYWFLSNQVCNY